MALAAPDLAARTGASPAVRPPGALAGERLLPVVPALEDLLPGGGLRRGATVAVAGSTSLALAVLAGPSGAGSWCAVVGLPALGMAAAAEMGVALDRLALVPVPGSEWPAVVAALLDALDVVMVSASRRVRPGDARRLVARARERGAVLLVVGSWEGAEVRLSVGGAGGSRSRGQRLDTSAVQWHGLGAGHGHLRARRVDVIAEGRGAASRARRCRLWLPAEGGGVERA